MATNLYETLEIPKDATVEQIRKAYKKKALQTHPDRLPITATPEDKTASEEQFRLVNNAYEVLSDVQNRRLYDLHGIWPPPGPEPEDLPRREGSRRRAHSHYHRAPRNNNFADPFFSGHYGPFSAFVFTDPFTLFDSIFTDSPFPHPHRYHQPYMPRVEDPFERSHRMHAGIGNFRAAMEQDMFPSIPNGFSNRSMFQTSSSTFPSLESSSFSQSNGSRWVKESVMTTSVNGVTQSIRKRRDWEGNEHVTRTYPDGREVHTINGVEQISSRPYLQPLSSHADSRHLPPPPVIGQPHINGSRSDYVVPPPPLPYPSNRGNYSGSPTLEQEYGRRHNRRFSENRPVIPGAYDQDAAFRPHEDHRQRKSWWHGRR